jgi:hypothetical protein
MHGKVSILYLLNTEARGNYFKILFGMTFEKFKNLHALFRILSAKRGKGTVQRDGSDRNWAHSIGRY